MSDAVQLYFAITVNQDGVVTGMHTCSNPMEQGFFAGSEEFSGDTVIPVDEMKTGILGLPLAALNEDYTPKPLVDRILDGFASVPAGHELIDGQLIKTEAPIEAQPQSIRQRIEDAGARIAALEEELKKLKPTITTLALDVVGLKQIEKPTSVKSK